MVRSERELTEITVHVFLRHVNLRASNRLLKQMLEVFHVVRVVHDAVLVVVLRPIFRTVLHGAMLVGVALQ